MKNNKTAIRLIISILVLCALGVGVFLLERGLPGCAPMDNGEPPDYKFVKLINMKNLNVDDGIIEITVHFGNPYYNEYNNGLLFVFPFSKDKTENNAGVQIFKQPFEILSDDATDDFEIEYGDKGTWQANKFYSEFDNEEYRMVKYSGVYPCSKTIKLRYVGNEPSDSGRIQISLVLINESGFFASIQKKIILEYTISNGEITVDVKK